ncbi:MAG TPA: DASS family sodium-coupled anion symporter [Candidatus Methylomirabilis sp.]|nr:DASS family sodium-coupled anion symporter [Candidatus Methylomirabilis sp.]
MATVVERSGGNGIIGYLTDNIKTSGRNPNRVLFGFLAAWIMFALIMWVFPRPEGLSEEGMTVLAIVAWASLMWVAEAMPVGITGICIPTLLILTHALPWVKNQPPLEAVFVGFTRHVVWLLLFALMVGALMQLLKLDRRIALAILDKIRASNVGRVIWGFFFVNVILSFLIPAAVARAATLLPIIKGVTNLLGDTPEERESKKAIVIQTLVYGSMITGMFIMTAHLPNMILVDIFGKNGYSIGYLDWMLLQFPYLGMFALTQWWVRHHFRTKRVQIAGGHSAIHKMHKDLGRMSKGEWVLLLVFAGIGLLFMMGKGSPIYQLHSFQLGIIGLIGILILFIPGLFPFTWKEVQDRTMWGTFLLLGGAITLTGAMSKSGLAAWLANEVHGLVTGHSWPIVLLIMMLGTHIMRIGMLSNVAAIAMLGPILFELGKQLGLHPVAFTMLVADTDTFAYLLPTQITAAVIAYGTDTFSTADYAKVGWLSILIAIAYGIGVMALWYAFLGMPLWDPSAPWPFK